MLGQLLPGLVSVFQPVEALPQVVGIPYVVFAGNVGDETTLAYVIDLSAEGLMLPRQSQAEAAVCRPVNSSNKRKEMSR